MNRSSIAIAVVLAAASCSSSYTPQSRGRVSVMMQGGSVAYVRDGQSYPHGFLGSGLVRAVSGNPAAEQAAEEYRDRLKTGLLTAIGGLACSTTAIAFMARDPDAFESGRPPTSMWVALGCSVLSLIGSTYMITAEPYRWDAINMFNDGVHLQPAPFSAPPGWSAARRETSLKMRD